MLLRIIETNGLELVIVVTSSSPPSSCWTSTRCLPFVNGLSFSSPSRLVRYSRQKIGLYHGLLFVCLPVLEHTGIQVSHARIKYLHAGLPGVVSSFHSSIMLSAANVFPALGLHTC